MPDPIAPTGSSGQLPQVAQTQVQAVFAPTSGAIQPEVKFAPVDGPAQEKPTEDVTLDIFQKQQSTGKSKEAAVSTPTLEEATKTFKDYLKSLPSDLQFKKDEDTGTVMFKIVNPVTKEVIREFPPEEVVEMSKRLHKLAQQTQKTGILMDTNS